MRFVRSHRVGSSGGRSTVGLEAHALEPSPLNGTR
jgi:hypothetical protein